MNFTKTAIVITLGLASFAALAGEIKNTTVDGRNMVNEATNTDSKALQHAGVAFGNGKITDSYISAYGAANYSTGVRSVAHQDIGVADGGTLKNTQVYGAYAQNWATGTDSVAVQQIGKVTGSNSKIQDSYIYGTGSFNYAGGVRSKAEQKIGVA